MAQFIQALISASQKAAHIAWTIRKEKDLFTLLVEEKKEEERNKRFFQDFKTLADVLIQETIRHDIGKQFPEIAAHIRGEENNQFTNTLGETVTVEVKSSEEETASLLAVVLDGNMNAANLLAAAVHLESEMKLNDSLNTITLQLPIASFGIWIDPIDSTAEYIEGKDMDTTTLGVYPSGLQCVTVLLGAYDRTNGQPVVGVVNQPFYNCDQSCKSNGRVFWGVSYGNIRATSIVGSTVQSRSGQRKIVVISSSESEKLKAALGSSCDLVFAAGAGYKQLCVALGLVDAYVLSKGSTYKWDCCAPHALLRSLGGGVVSYQRAVTIEHKLLAEGNKVSANLELQYNVSSEASGDTRGMDLWCNSGGIITYRDVATLKEIVSLLRPETVTAL